MDEIPLSALFTALIVLIIMSAFFSSSETAMMSLNRYRLKHLSKAGHPGAKRASKLLDRPDRLIGMILLGNNFVNILASSIATIIALRLYGETGIAIATGLLTIVILIFAEVTPKTLAALHPERIAFPSAFIYIPLIKILYPIVWLISMIASGLLRLFGVRSQDSVTQLSREELRTVVNEAGALIPRRHQKMLIGILDLEKITVEDIMIPRNEIVGIDLNDESWDNILTQLTITQHTRLPLFRGDINNLVGIIHVRTILHKLTANELNFDTLMALAKEPYYIPEGTSLNSQLLNFQHHKRRIGMVVDEYGDIHGLVTLEDILEEIVGKFTTDASLTSPDIHAQEDGSYLVTGSANIREINRTMNWHLPTDGPKTLNGLILEYLESIPSPGTALLIANYPIEIVQTAENTVKIIRISPRLKSLI